MATEQRSKVTILKVRGSEGRGNRAQLISLDQVWTSYFRAYVIKEIETSSRFFLFICGVGGAGPAPLSRCVAPYNSQVFIIIIRQILFRQAMNTVTMERGWDPRLNGFMDPVNLLPWR